MSKTCTHLRTIRDVVDLRRPGTGQLTAGIVALVLGAPPTASEVAWGRVRARVLTEGRDFLDVKGLARERYDGRPTPSI